MTENTIMTEERPSGRAFFDRQQQRRREMQARLAGMPVSDETLDSEAAVAPSAAPGRAGQRAAEPVVPEPESWAEPSPVPEPESPAEPSPIAEPESPAEPFSIPEPESPAEPSPLPEPESWPEPFAAPEPETRIEPAVPPEPVLMLVMTSGPNVGETFVLHRRELIIGREEGSDIRLDDLTVSHNHALVRARGDVVTIEDLRSKNGTTVNGAAISSPVPIALGDVITVGAVEFVVERR